MDHLEYHELSEKLRELDAQKADVERALAAKRNTRKKELAAEFKSRANEEGFDWEEICGISKRRATSGRSYVAKDDPNCVYTRGPLPVWMKDKMAAAGLDPTSKADREQFKADYMIAA
jgi:DNA-binding protein H-NS